MSANAVDQRFHFAQGLGQTRRVALSTTANDTVRNGASAEQRPADALKPGKYLVQVHDMDVSETCWIRATPVSSTANAVAPAAVADMDIVNDFPLHGSSSPEPSFILHVRKGVNDRISAVLSAATATMMITRIGE